MRLGRHPRSAGDRIHPRGPVLRPLARARLPFRSARRAHKAPRPRAPARRGRALRRARRRAARRRRAQGDPRGGRGAAPRPRAADAAALRLRVEPRDRPRLPERPSARRVRGVRRAVPADLRGAPRAADSVPRRGARGARGARRRGGARGRARPARARPGCAGAPAPARGGARMTEDFLAVVETKRFLGQEFLTWLVHRIEEDAAPADAELSLGDRAVLADAAGDRLTVAGTGVARGERRWELSLDGGLLVYEGLRCPKLGPRDAGAHEDRRAAFENDLFLRLADVEEALAILDGLFAEFCRLRGSAAWAARELPALRAWVERLG